MDIKYLFKNLIEKINVLTSQISTLSAQISGKVSKSGDTMSGSLKFSSNESGKTYDAVNIWSDSEGGNIDIHSGNGHSNSWQIDSYNGNLRFYTFNESSQGNYVDFVISQYDGVKIPDVVGLWNNWTYAYLDPYTESFPTLSQYDFILIDTVAFGSNSAHFLTLLPVNCGPTQLQYNGYNNDNVSNPQSFINCVYREINVGSDKITFGNGQMIYNGSVYRNWNSRCVPYRIWGVKCI